MLTDDVLPAEGPRYAAPLVLVPGLWAGRDVCRPFATFLAHRGWDCRLVDLRGLGGLDARIAALATYLGTLPVPAVLVGHDAGALVAHQAALRHGAAAVVLLAPLRAGDPAARALVVGLRTVFRVALGRPVGPPGATALAPLLGDLPPAERTAIAARLGTDDGAALRDLVRRRLALTPASAPTLVVAGERDPLLPPPAARALADAVHAELDTVPAAGHWLLGGAAWQRVVGSVHRWVVQRLGEPLLETYADAMAAREEDG